MLPAPRRHTVVVVVKWQIGVVTRKNAVVVRILDVISLVPALVHLVERRDTVVVHVKLRIGRITKKNAQVICARWVWLNLRKL